jgi:flagellar biosynthesis protein FliQ
MIDYATLLDHAQHALVLTVLLSLPTVGIAALVSLVMAIFQAATQVNDMTIAHLPRFVAVVVTLAVSLAWMGNEIVAFTTRVFGAG